MSKKREKRIQAVTKEYEESVVASSVLSTYENIDDNVLFTIDRDGSQRKRQKVEKELLPKEKKTYISPTERVLIEKIQKAKKEGTGKAKYGEKIVSTRKERSKKIDSNLGDIWAKEELKSDVPSSSSIKPLVSKKIRVALPGQSYHPRTKDHQDILAEALALEMKAKEKEGKLSLTNNTSVAGQVINFPSLDNLTGEEEMVNPPTGYSVQTMHLENKRAKEITNLLLMENQSQNSINDSDDNDSDDSDSDDDDENSAMSASTSSSSSRRHKQPEKLTRAQLNRRKAIRLAQHECMKTAFQEKLNNKIESLDQLLSEIEKEEIKQNLNKQLREQYRKAKKHLLSNKKKAISLSEIREYNRKRLALEYKKKQQQQQQGEEEVMEEEDGDDEEQIADESLTLHEVSAIPLSDELNSSLRQIIPKGVAVKDYMHTMVESGYMNPKRVKAYKPRENPYNPPKVKWIPKYKY